MTLFVKILGIASAAAFTLSQFGAGSVSLHGIYEPAVPEKLRIKD
jgi:cyclic lactone autoinducer peptide